MANYENIDPQLLSMSGTGVPSTTNQQGANTGSGELDLNEFNLDNLAAAIPEGERNPFSDNFEFVGDALNFPDMVGGSQPSYAPQYGAQTIPPLPRFDYENLPNPLYEEPNILNTLSTRPRVNTNQPFNSAPALKTPKDYHFQNEILSQFQSPITPLQIIDRMQFPFDQKLQGALQQRLDSEAEQQIGMKLRSTLQDRPAPTSTGKVSKNKRPENIKKLDPRKYYASTPPRTKNWGDVNPLTNDHLFRYTPYGELLPQDNFTPQQIIDFIAKHPKRGAPGHQSGLVLWLQIAPSDSSSRYPTKDSDKCRFVDCPVKHHTIHKGDPRVAFDEFYCENQQDKKPYDPFHCAMYVHLYCFEKFLDFPHLCKSPFNNVTVDDRVLPEGRNKMALTRDHPKMKDVAEDFMRKSIPWGQFPPDNRRPQVYHHLSLTYAVIKTHLDSQNSRFQKVREERGGNSIDRHFGNLDDYAAYELVKPRKKPYKRKASSIKNGSKSPPKTPASKRKRGVPEDEDEDAEFEFDDNILDADYRPSGPRSRSGSGGRRTSPKRTRVEGQQAPPPIYGGYEGFAPSSW
ncbi:hypothetical protein G7Y89_g6328 [Cudoniella acicularis]|uniref:Uncharacterized protein n=1 Tax=Cudoniella acicularis TaxID=354080 RepID=A0A8H4RKN3_9HELO|nr:hypothetical protein G7Y89_g6328 [Cudoniella acicularis]